MSDPNFVPANPRPVKSQAEQAREARHASLLSDSDTSDLMARLGSASNAEIEQFVDENVTSIADVRRRLKALFKMLAAKS